MVMQPSVGNPELRRARYGTIKLPLSGVDRSLHALNMPQGAMWNAENLWLKNQILQTFPAQDGASVLTWDRLPWHSGADQEVFLQAHPAFNDPQIPLRLYTTGRVQNIKDTTPLSVFTIAGTVATTSGLNTITGSGTSFFAEGMAYGSYLKVTQGGTTEWVQLNSVSSATAATALSTFHNTFTAATVEVWQTHFRQFSGNPSPVSCHVGGTDVIVGDSATYYVHPTTGDVRVLTGVYRGQNVISFAGRPVLINVREATSAFGSYISGTAYPLRLRWPTRGDMTDWTSYGSGFLDLLDHEGPLIGGIRYKDDAYVFTNRNVFQLYSTGQSAANPIAYRVATPQAFLGPVSNVVVGVRGAYFWTAMGPARYSPNGFEPLWSKLGLTIETSMIFANPFRVQYSPFLEAVLFTPSILTGQAGEGWIFFEDYETFISVSEHNRILQMDQDAQSVYSISSGPIETATADVAMLVDDKIGTYSMDGSAVTADAYWRGITMEEGPQVYKAIQKVYFKYTGSGTAQFVIRPEGSVTAQSNVVFTLTTSIQDKAVDLSVDEAQVFECLLTIPRTLKILEITIQYVVGGDAAS